MPVLGLKRKKKYKAKPSEFPGLGPISVGSAFKELTPYAFAYWVRIHGEPDAMIAGRIELAKLTGYSVRRSNDILRELHRKGFLGFVRRPGGRTSVVIYRRLTVEPRSGFYRAY